MIFENNKKRVRFCRGVLHTPVCDVPGVCNTPLQKGGKNVTFVTFLLTDNC